MKKNFIIATLLLLSAVAGSVSAQTKSQGVRFGFGLEGALPVGNLSTAYNVGGGATLRLGIPAGPNGMATGTAGVIAFAPKSISGLNTKAELNIPIKAGYQYTFAGPLYGMGEAGLTIAKVYYPSASTGSLASASSTSFTYSVGVGAHLGFFDPSIRYEGYTGSGFIGLRLGFGF